MTELFRTFELTKKLGVIVIAHCENAEAVSQLQAKLLSAGKTGPKWHKPSRPPSVDASGVEHLVIFAALTVRGKVQVQGGKFVGDQPNSKARYKTRAGLVTSTLVVAVMVRSSGK